MQVRCSQWETANNTHSIAAGGGATYLTSYDSPPQTVNVVDPPYPEVVCSLYSAGKTADFVVAEDRAYLINEPTVLANETGHLTEFLGTFNTVSVSNPALPVMLGSHTVSKPLSGYVSLSPFAFDVAATRNTVYAVWCAGYGFGSLDILDLTDPSAPSLVGSWSPPEGVPTAIALSGDIAYVGASYGDYAYTTMLYIVDISAPASPTILGSCELHASVGVQKIVYKDGMVYVEYMLDMVPFPTIDTVDVHDPSAPVPTATIYGSSPITAVDNTLYVGRDPGSVFDISVPSTPTPIGLLDTILAASPYGNVGFMAATHDRLYALEMESWEGSIRMYTCLRVDVTDRENPVILDYQPCPYLTKAVAQDGYIYGLDGMDCFWIIDEGRVSLTINVVGAGSTDPAPSVYPYDEITQVAITAIPEPGYKLDHWEGDVETTTPDNPLVVTVDAEKSVTAVFTEITYTLTTAKQGFGDTNPIPGVHTFVHDTPVTISATPEPGWRFDHWEGDFGDDASANPIVVTMTADKSLTAVFEPVVHTLALAVSGQGETTPTVGTTTYPAGTQINATATPAEGWRFDHWEGDVSGNDTANPLMITLDQDRCLTAVFVEDTAGCSGGGTGSKTDAATVGLAALGLWLASLFRSISVAGNARLS